MNTKEIKEKIKRVSKVVATIEDNIDAGLKKLNKELVITDESNIIKGGNSKYLSIPSTIFKEGGFKVGDKMKFVFDKKSGVMQVEKV